MKASRHIGMNVFDFSSSESWNWLHKNECTVCEDKTEDSCSSSKQSLESLSYPPKRRHPKVSMFIPKYRFCKPVSNLCMPVSPSVLHVSWLYDFNEILHQLHATGYLGHGKSKSHYGAIWTEVPCIVGIGGVNRCNFRHKICILTCYEHMEDFVWNIFVLFLYTLISLEL